MLGKKERVVILPCSQAPAQLITLDLLGDLDLSLDRHLVTSVQQRHHEVKVHAVLATVAELLEGPRDRAEHFPRLLSAADAAGETVELTQRERVGHSERLGAIVEVGENVDVLRGECLGQ